MHARGQGHHHRPGRHDQPPWKVVARGMGRPCVSGAGEMQIDGKAGTFRARGRTFKAGDLITIDGSKGQVMAGKVKMVEPELSGDFAALMGWADKARRHARRHHL